MGTNTLSERLSADVLSILRESVQDKIFPGAVAALISSTGETYIPFGHYTYDPSARPITSESIFDAASLTKVVATATAVMQLVEREQLSLNDLACEFLPQLGQAPKDRITIFQLLAHTAGFPGGEPLQGRKSRDEIFEAICSMDLQYAPGSDRVYDDVGYILLGFIVEAVTGVTLNDYCKRHIFEPLKMGETTFAPDKTLLERIVPTEVDPRRGGLIQGVVHDERAFVMGGVAGHAGMFTTARDLGRFSRLVTPHDQGAFAGILSNAGVRLMCSRQWQDTEGEYGLGWDRFRPSYMDGIDDCDAIGHTGFTGVSLVISPQRDLAIILLSNRIHPVRSDGSFIHLVRRRLVEAVIRQW
jgi:CubicO group peptidase (beta-lactamase class C family)